MTGLPFGSGTDIGHHSDNNEDSFCTVPELGLWLIADGMGGHESGEVASAIVSETIVNEVRNGVGLVEAVQKAHRTVISASENGSGSKGMGSTVVVLQVKDKEFEVAWVGDSRAYLWNGELRQISRDHSYVQKLLDSGAITEEEALHHPNRNIITQSLGADLSDVVVDNITGQFCRGQRVLMCSDGLSDEIEDSEIAFILKEGGDEQVLVDKLIQSALKSGGKDNVSVVLVSAPDDAPEELQDSSSFTEELNVLKSASATGKFEIPLQKNSNNKLWIGIGMGVIGLIAIFVLF